MKFILLTIVYLSVTNADVNKTENPKPKWFPFLWEPCSCPPPAECPPPPPCETETPTTDQIEEEIQIITESPRTEVSLFSSLFFRGDEYKVDLSERCHDLDLPEDTRVGSLDVGDNCMMMFEQPGCTGNWRKIKPETCHVDEYNKLKMRNPRSVRKCLDSDPDENPRTHRYLNELDIQFQGYSYTKRVGNSCVNLNENEQFNMISIILWNNCIMGYDEPDCNGNGKRLGPGSRDVNYCRVTWNTQIASLRACA